MKTSIRLLPILLAAALQQGALAAPAQQGPLEPGWTALFNGTDLTGWKINGNVAAFKNIRIKPLD
jgi:hypothetical protein